MWDNTQCNNKGNAVYWYDMGINAVCFKLVTSIQLCVLETNSKQTQPRSYELFAINFRWICSRMDVED
jgi:hypothetical protein